MYKIRPSVKFQKDLKRVQKRGYDISLLKNVLNLLVSGEPLPAKYKDHSLLGNYTGCRECHITPDWLLVYEIEDSELILGVPSAYEEFVSIRNRFKNFAVILYI